MNAANETRVVRDTKEIHVFLDTETWVKTLAQKGLISDGRAWEEGFFWVALEFRNFGPQTYFGSPEEIFTISHAKEGRHVKVLGAAHTQEKAYAYLDYMFSPLLDTSEKAECYIWEIEREIRLAKSRANFWDTILALLTD